MIQLTQGKVVIVDDADMPTLEKYNRWAVKLGHCWYAATKIDGRRVLMHRLLLSLDIVDPMMVDHINGDGLDNTRSNIRYADATLNMRNRTINSNSSTGISGVTFRKNHGTSGAWVALGVIDRKFKTKTFSCSKYGYDEAKILAVEWRKQHEAEYGITVR